ncbi:NmrA family NAD(P)-binding protein [Oceaniglobus trochenteri]|uniref:NmrA family NAD(P)-binding protein n=1 Tax=Oceaniglobus trochenteri TaxID=2763260 RepID=UPI001CFF5F68|nr:NmrA family NAD(P)-binding protein [Oceaniglobus trochenteri]
MDILITGATGNVGAEVIGQLAGSGHRLFAGVRDGTPVPGATPVTVDFAAGQGATGRYDAVFLMRPPQLTDPDLFAAFLDPLDRATRIVFLSVQGAGEAGYLPHAKIEKRIVEMGFDHVFVRPAYFMENLLTTLWPELERDGEIYLPSGELALDWVSVRDIAALCALALTGQVSRPVVTVCSGRFLRFDEVCAIINRIAGTDLRYVPAGLFAYVRRSRRDGTGWGMIFVMLLLHWLPRFTRRPRHDCSDIPALLHRPPEPIEDFVTRHRARFARLGR